MSQKAGPVFFSIPVVILMYVERSRGLGVGSLGSCVLSDSKEGCTYWVDSMETLAGGLRWT